MIHFHLTKNVYKKRVYTENNLIMQYPFLINGPTPISFYFAVYYYSHFLKMSLNWPEKEKKCGMFFNLFVNMHE